MLRGKWKSIRCGRVSSESRLNARSLRLDNDQFNDTVNLHGRIRCTTAWAITRDVLINSLAHVVRWVASFVAVVGNGRPRGDCTAPSFANLRASVAKRLIRNLEKSIESLWFLRGNFTDGRTKRTATAAVPRTLQRVERRASNFLIHRATTLEGEWNQSLTLQLPRMGMKGTVEQLSSFRRSDGWR